MNLANPLVVYVGTETAKNAHELPIPSKENEQIEIKFNQHNLLHALSWSHYHRGCPCLLLLFFFLPLGGDLGVSRTGEPPGVDDHGTSNSSS